MVNNLQLAPKLFVQNLGNYFEPGPDAYTKARQKNMERALKKKLEALGYGVIEKNKAV